MIVVDASAVIDFVLRTPRGVRLDSVIFRAAEPLHAPHLLDLEVLQVLRRFWLSGSLDIVRAEEAISDFLALPIERHPHETVVHRVWELRSNLTAYDASYVALAELLGVRLITTDARLAKSSAARHIAELLQ